jgi:hypothetical protein
MAPSDVSVEDVVDRVEEWCTFGDGRAYILMAIARKKFNEDITNTEEVVHRRVISDDEQIEEQVGDLLAMMERRDLSFRLYLTVNARDVVRAYHFFFEKMVSWSQELHDGHDPAIEKMGRLSSEWKSVLHAPGSRDECFFLFDVDDVSEEEGWRFERALDEHTDVKGYAVTPNGYHFVTETFNYEEFEPPVEYDELDTDGMIHIAEIQS